MLVSVSRKKDNHENDHKSSINEQISCKFKDIDKIIVMSGTATREPKKNENKPQIQKDNSEILNNYRINFSKLRVPLTKQRKKRLQKSTNKFCEMLFEYIKPYKKVIIEKKTEITQSHQLTTSILKKDEITFKKRATRKVQFFSVGEENPESFSFINERMIELEQSTDLNLKPGKESKYLFQMGNICGSKAKKTKPIVSSEDFIKTVFNQH